MPKATPIPFKSRDLVTIRDQGRCFRCGMRAGEWHHRRSRSVRDGTEHATTNGILLDRTCHVYVHGHPIEALENGWIVSRYKDPATQPILRWDGVWCLLDDKGGFFYKQKELDQPL